MNDYKADLKVAGIISLYGSILVPLFLMAMVCIFMDRYFKGMLVIDNDIFTKTMWDCFLLFMVVEALLICIFCMVNDTIKKI